MSCVTRHPNSSNTRGTNVDGPASVTCAPSFVSSQMFDRATREYKMSPRMVTFNPAMRPFFSRIVNASSNACVGCSCAPSPALITLAFNNRDKKCGAPAAE